jgi:rhomboid family GlyGly-CTERM serine protease
MSANALGIRIRLRSVNCDGKYGAALLAACGLVLVLQFSGAAAIRLLRYDRAAIASGEWWRLLTAHLVHLNFSHAVLDLGGLALLWALFARDLTPRAWALLIVATIAVIDCGLWFRDPRITWYLGLSGVLHGVLAAAVVVRLRRGNLEGWALGGLLLTKLAYEQLHGAMPFDGSDLPVVVDAHLYGALGGLAAVIVPDLWTPLAWGSHGNGAGGGRLAESTPAQEIHQTDQHDGAEERHQHGAQTEEALARRVAQ